MLRLTLQIFALAGILAGRLTTALLHGFRVGAAVRAPSNNFGAVIAQQNTIMLQHLIAMQMRLLSAIVDSDSSAEETVSVGEVTCSAEHAESLRKIIDAPAEQAIKDMSSWASGVVNEYELQLRGVSLETDRPSEIGRELDVVLVFHVDGNGAHALRFQSRAARKLQEMKMSAAEESVNLLRIDVRWKSA